MIFKKYFICRIGLLSGTFSLSAFPLYLIAYTQGGDGFSGHLFEQDREGGNHRGHP